MNTQQRSVLRDLEFCRSRKELANMIRSQRLHEARVRYQRAVAVERGVCTKPRRQIKTSLLFASLRRSSDFMERFAKQARKLEQTTAQTFTYGKQIVKYVEGLQQCSTCYQMLETCNRCETSGVCPCCPCECDYDNPSPEAKASMERWDEQEARLSRGLARVG